MFTAELRKRVSGLGVAALAVSPGFVATPMVRNPTPWFLQPLVSLLAQTPAQGARTVLFAATAPHLGLPLAHQQAPAPVSSNCSESQDAASTSSPPPSSAMSSSQPLTPEALLRLPLLLHDCKPAAVAAAASNADGCARLWALSAKVVGLGGPQQQSKGGHQDYL